MTRRAHLAWGILFAFAGVALAAASARSPNPENALVAAGVAGLACTWHLTRWVDQ